MGSVTALRIIMATEYAKPLPDPHNVNLSSPFWEAAKRHALVMPRCKTCSELFFYPRELCPACLSTELEWVPVSGKGRVYSYTVVHQPAHPAFRADAPHVFAIIQLDEGIRMPSNIVECPIEDVAVDMRVPATFEDVTPEVTLIKFRPER
jgi:uncharacterized OB-fold protein